MNSKKYIYVALAILSIHAPSFAISGTQISTLQKKFNEALYSQGRTFKAEVSADDLTQAAESLLTLLSHNASKKITDRLQAQMIRAVQASSAAAQEVRGELEAAAQTMQDQIAAAQQQVRPLAEAYRTNRSIQNEQALISAQYNELEKQIQKVHKELLHTLLSEDHANLENLSKRAKELQNQKRTLEGKFKRTMPRQKAGVAQAAQARRAAPERRTTTGRPPTPIAAPARFGQAPPTPPGPPADWHRQRAIQRTQQIIEREQARLQRLQGNQ